MSAIRSVRVLGISGSLRKASCNTAHAQGRLTDHATRAFVQAHLSNLIRLAQRPGD